MSEPELAHDFGDCLRFSLAADKRELFDRVYRERWPDRALQLAGVDVLVHLPYGKRVQVDEKVRRRRWEGDVLLERWSDFDRRTPGWAWNERYRCDYVGLLYLHGEQVCLLVPRDDAQRAYRLNEWDWLAKASAGLTDLNGWCSQRSSRGHPGRDGFGLVRALNRGWVTISVTVPKPVLDEALVTVNVIRLGTS